MKALRSQGTAKVFWGALLWLGLMLSFSKSAPAKDAPLRVAFLTVTDVNNAPDWRASALSDSASERLKIVPGWVILERAQVVAAEESAARSGAKGEALRASVAAALKADIVFQAALSDAGALSATISALQKQGEKGPQEVTVDAGVDPVLGLPAALAKGAVALAGAEIPALTQGFVSSAESSSVKAFELYARGVSLMSDKLDGAEKSLRAALKEDPNYARAAAALSKVLCFKSDYAAEKGPLLDEALSLASQSIKLLSASPEAHVAVGRVHDFAGRPAKAAAEYSEAIKLSPYEVTALNNRAIILLDNLRQFRLARQDLETALTANPDYVLARINLGRALIALADGEAAVAALSPMIETPPANPYLQKLALKLYAESLSLAGRSGPANTTLDDFAAANPDEEDLAKYRALVQLNSGKYPEAIKLLEEYLGKVPNSAEGQQTMAWAIFKSGDAKAAITRLKELTSNNPKFVSAWRDLGIIQAMSGSLEDAKASLSSGLEFAPEDPELSYNVGVAALNLGDLVTAEKLLRQATTLDPLFSQAWYNLGIVCSQANKTTEAKDAFERATTLAPKNASAKIGLALALRSSDPAAAKKALQEASTSAKDPGVLFQAKLNLGLLCAEQRDVACATEALSAASKDAPPGFEASASHAKQVLDALQGRAP